jgi:hypothetical protein
MENRILTIFMELQEKVKTLNLNSVKTPKLTEQERMVLMNMTTYIIGIQRGNY